MNAKTIWATLALLGSGSVGLSGCDGPKAPAEAPAKEVAPAEPPAHEDADKAEMSCAPGKCGAEPADEDAPEPRSEAGKATEAQEAPAAGEKTDASDKPPVPPMTPKES